MSTVKARIAVDDTVSRGFVESTKLTSLHRDSAHLGIGVRWPLDTGSFAAGPNAEVVGSTLRLSCQGGAYTLSESAIAAAQSTSP